MCSLWDSPKKKLTPYRRSYDHNDYDLTFKQLRTQERLAAALGSQSWDIVLAEDAVPGFSALAALEFLQEAKLDLPIILISKDSRGDTALTAVRAGFHDCLTAQERKRLLPAVEPGVASCCHTARAEAISTEI